MLHHECLIAFNNVYRLSIQQPRDLQRLKDQPTWKQCHLLQLVILNDQKWQLQFNWLFLIQIISSFITYRQLFILSGDSPETPKSPVGGGRPCVIPWDVVQPFVMTMHDDFDSTKIALMFEDHTNNIGLCKYPVS
jgi:hypothetical protein